MNYRIIGKEVSTFFSFSRFYDILIMVEDEMIEKSLIEILKKDISIFIKEYSDFLDENQLEILKNIDYNNIFIFSDINIPFGTVYLDKIYISNTNIELINNLKKMPNYNSKRFPLINKNLSSYIKYMCDNGYDLINLYNDIIWYFIFSMVIKNNSFLIKGFINQEMKFLSIKYSINIGSLYAREERIVNEISPFFKIDNCRKIMFMSYIDAFKYICDNFGYRYAVFFNNICEMTNKEYSKINKEYIGFDGFLNYTNDYDHLSYLDIYNYILDFKASSSLNI